MIAKINDSKFVNDISSNQTFELYSKFSLMFPGAIDQIMVLSQVNLMTPENIHLNMSALHLYDLYGKIKALV